MTPERLDKLSNKILLRHRVLVEQIFNEREALSETELGQLLNHQGLTWKDFERVKEGYSPYVWQPKDVVGPSPTMWIWTKDDQPTGE